MPEPLLLALVVAVLIAALFVPFKTRIRTKPKRRRYRGGLGPALGAINEIFNPSALKASITLEEKKIARKATPAAEDPLDRLTK